MLVLRSCILCASILLKRNKNFFRKKKRGSLIRVVSDNIGLARTGAVRHAFTGEHRTDFHEVLAWCSSLVWDCLKLSFIAMLLLDREDCYYIQG